MNKKINFIGWQNHDNLGDEAIYYVDQKLFPKYNLVSSNDRLISNITLFGGGTLLPHWPYICPINKYNYAFGVGVQDIKFIKNYKNCYIDLTKKSNFRYLMVRGYISQKILKSWGIQSEVIGDPVLSLEPNQYHSNPDSKRIMINLAFYNDKVWGDNETNIYIQMKNFCEYLKTNGYNPIIIPFWKKDELIINRFANDLGLEVFKDWLDIEKTLNFIATGNALVGLKLHSLVFSAAAYVPFISIEYNPKCFDFSNSVGFDSYNIPTDKLTADKLIMLFNNLIKNRNMMKNQLEEKVSYFRLKQKEAVAKITQDIESLNYKDYEYLSGLYYISKDFIIKRSYQISSLINMTSS